MILPLPPTTHFDTRLEGWMTSIPVTDVLCSESKGGSLSHLKGGQWLSTKVRYRGWRSTRIGSLRGYVSSVLVTKGGMGVEGGIGH